MMYKLDAAPVTSECFLQFAKLMHEFNGAEFAVVDAAYPGGKAGKKPKINIDVLVRLAGVNPWPPPVTITGGGAETL